jgi:hypothetical protein
MKWLHGVRYCECECEASGIRVTAKGQKKLQSIARHSRVGSPHRAPTFVAALAPARNMSHGPKGGYLVG